MATFGKCGGGGRRGAVRRSAPLLALVTTIGKTYTAILLDLSCTGAKLRGNDLPSENHELVLKIERTRAFGRVAWKRDNECGIVFDDPLPDEVVITIRQKATKAGGLTPEMRAAHNDWTIGTAR